MSSTPILKALRGALFALLLAASPQPLRALDVAGIEDLEFSGLEEKADEVVKVNLWGRPLEQAKRLLGLRKNVTASARKFMSGLTAVYRRTYRFSRERPSEEDIMPVHQRLADGGWVPLIETADHGEPDSLSVYSMYEGEVVAGMTVVSSNAGEVTVLKVMGPVDFEALSEIGTGLGLPLMNVATSDIQKVNASGTGE